MKKITDEIINEMIKLYNEDYTVTDISYKIGSTKNTVAKYLQLNGYDTSKKPYDIKGIIKDYENGLFITEIVKKYKMAFITVSKILKENGCDTRNHIKKYDDKKIIELYLTGSTIKEICEILHHRGKTISKILKKNNIKIRTKDSYNEKRRTYKIDENFFEKIDTPEKAYILGLLYADGCMKKDSTKFELTLQEDDKEILEKINKIMNYNKPLTFIKKRKETHKNSYRLLISCVKMCKDLVLHGMRPNKTFDCEFPDFLEEELKRHFVRGFFDGDGCVHTCKNKTPDISFVGYYKMLETMQKYLFSKNIESFITCSSRYHKDIKLLRFGNAESVINFYNLMYESSTIHLDRKHNKFVKGFVEHKKENKFKEFKFNKI